ncbi:hypothetical protein [Thermoplasma sp.]|uniref:hypothetical protein n=1 Tax=Thermoplasma sp. TaxID=1973142 RepID=UPI001282EB7C|nr:hypothetical protein [Thermoplasma sp.]KAA8922046.1 MAG: hypothetical protein F6Q11_06510 [Thermoplasma sp.]
MSSSRSSGDTLSSIIALILLFTGIVILPLYGAYFFYRWSRYRTIAPMAIVVTLFSISMMMTQFVTPENYGGNYNLAMMADTMLVLGSILLFFAWIIGQIYRLAIGSEERNRMEKMYRKPGFVKEAILEHHLVLTAASPLSFIALTLLNYSGVHGGLSTFLDVLWYLSLIGYFFIAAGIVMMWALSYIS